MVYLLTLGWAWFAAACALGALTGFVTTPDDKNAPAAPGWILAATALALVAGFAASWLELFGGREAVAFDVALLASAAYLVGLPLGGALKSARASAPASEAKRPIVVLRAAMEAQPRATAPSQSAAASATESDQHAAIEAAAGAVQALHEKAAEMRAPAKSIPGTAPATLSAPRAGKADDLSKIKGLGPKSVEKLNALGVFHFDQIAGWSADNVKWVEASIGATGRVSRNGWVEQAQKLAGVAQRESDAA